MATFYGTHRPPPSVPRTDFGPAPPGYIPGIGRGAVGFTTRSDIGPAKPMQEEQVVGRSRVLPIPPLPLGYGARQGIPTVAPPPTAASATTAASSSPAPTVSVAPQSAPASSSSTEASAEAADAATYSDANFDSFGGYNERPFAKSEYDAEDAEADAIYDAVDRRVDSRRKRRREEKEQQLSAQQQTPQAAISSTFADVKRQLAAVTEDEWAAIPESLDFSHRNALTKQQNARERFTPLPDSIIASATALITSTSASKHSALSTAVDTAVGASSSSASASNGATPDLTSIGRARDKMLGLKLDRMADSVSGQTVVDPRGYMTELSGQHVSSAAEVSDIKKARLLMQSVIDSNPSLGSGYIGLSRLEKDTGRLREARAVIMQGCEHCPQSEDVWIEAALLHTGKAARAIVAKAIAQLPTSIQLWQLAAKLEPTAEQRKLVLRRALELIPNSIGLWKAAVEMEDEEGARVLLSRAVELVPESVDMWLAYARLSSYQEARSILNRARRAVPTDSSIWITAAKLEEANGKAETVSSIIEKAVKSLQAYEVRMDRESWLAEAELAERSGAVETCRAIVAATIGMGVDELDRRNTWLTDAEQAESRGAVHTARAMLSRLLASFPSKKSLWLRAAQFERQHGSKDALLSLLAAGTAACPQSELLWLMYAKEEWTAGRVEAARSILERAHGLNSESEEIWLAAAKIEYESRETERARVLLQHARERCRTARVWMKSAKLERALGERQRERTLIDEGLQRWPDDWKLGLMKAQWLQREGDAAGAREAYKQAVKLSPLVAVLWVEYAKFEMQLAGQQLKQSTASSAAPPAATVSADGFALPAPPVVTAASALSKARAILEAARLKLPKNSLLWLTTIRIESAAASPSQSASSSSSAASHALSKALQECPTSGLLWSEAILSAAVKDRKARSYDALKRCSDDPLVFEAVGRLLWSEGKLSKARDWFERALRVSAGYGDVWLWLYRMETEAEGAAAGATGSRSNAVLQRCVERDPSHGEMWTAVSKDDRYLHCKAADILQIASRRITEILPGERIIAMIPSAAAAQAAAAVKKESQAAAAAAATASAAAAVSVST